MIHDVTPLALAWAALAFTAFYMAARVRGRK